jgi:hypothetical protein
MLSNFKIVFFCFFSGLTFSQNDLGFFYDQSNKILTARALGLGGAYTSIADDASALHWNPASLACLRGPSVVVTGGLQANFGNLKETEQNSTGYSLTTTATYDESPITFNFNQIAVAVPIVINKNRGVRITPSFGYSYSSNFTHLKEHWLVKDHIFDASSGLSSDLNTNVYYEINGGRRDFSYGFGISINEFISFGITQHTFGGERNKSLIYTEDQDLVFYLNASSITKIDFKGQGTTFAFKYASYGEIDPESDDYETGVDLSLVVDLPSTKTNKVIEDGISYTLYQNTSPRFKFGFSGRSASTLFCLDAIYEPTKLNTITKNAPMISSDLIRISSDSTKVLSIGAGIESLKVVRFGVRAKQYQYKKLVDITGTETKQPWTFQLNGGFSFGDMFNHFNFDIGGSLEFYNWGTVYSSQYSYVDYKGVLFNLLASFRMNIPYN